MSFSEDNGVLARIEGLNSSAHSVVLQLNALDSQFEFDKAIFTAGTGMTGGDLVNQTFRETDSAWSFDSSAWIELGPLSPIPRNGQVVRGTTQTGKPATLQFQGSAVYLYGDRVSNHGVYQVTLDGVASKFNGSSPDFVQDALLFLGAGLDPAQQHTLALENLSQDQFVDFEYAVVLHLNNGQPLSAPSTGKSTSVGVIAGGVVGGVALLGFLGAIVFFVLRRRRRHAAQRVDGVTSISEVFTERYAAQPWTHSRAPSSTEVTPFVAPAPSYNPTHGQLPEPSSKLAAKGFEKPSPHAPPVSDTAPSRPMSPSNMTTTGSASIYSADDSQRPPLSHNDMERVLEFVASRIDRTSSAPPGSAASDLDVVPPPHYG
ncbi:hypothetical protein EXIGLDRAFT_96901 [Exidia glandulosa HHB12029]|uniref:Transmembrane protein n=1 Tax=Exidia glandulosa HHB12029 TaxID=1314781 RepID=A0A165H3F0_EXIGL|nr:hypothetical protein EXIGLDRAFT_96901 [Exidia glandulosa HHB12029]